MSEESENTPQEKVSYFSEDSPSEQPQEKILGKFDSQEDLAKAYSELEAKLGAPKEEATEEVVEEKVEDIKLEKSSLQEKMPDLEAEYAENGHLTDESYEMLQKKYDLPRELVDDYIKYRNETAMSAEEAQLLVDIHKEVGGQEAYGEMQKWARENWSEQEVSQFNEVMDSGNHAAIKLAVNSLKKEFKSNGGGANPLMGKTGAASVGDVFNSKEEIRVAMSDRRYERDSAYRRKVQEKLLRSGNI